MKRTFPYLAIGLLAIIFVVEWHSIRANDEKTDPVTEDRAEISEVIRIVERIEELEKRLRYRSTETEDKIRQRMEKANTELSYAKDFDVILINDDLDSACKIAYDLVANFLSIQS